MFFSTKTITVEFGCSKANQPKVLADMSADDMFAYSYMYSCIAITRAGSIKRAGRDKFFIYYLKVASRVEKIAIYYIEIYEQAGKNV